jgi:hypothetical protein
VVRVADGAPQPCILWPSPGVSLPGNEPVGRRGVRCRGRTSVGSGVALDTGWQRDRDGRRNVARRLEAWAHEALLTERDTAGQEQEAQVRFGVQAVSVPHGAAPALDGYCDDPAYEGALALMLAPYNDGSRASARLLQAKGDVQAAAGWLWACFSGLQGGRRRPAAAHDATERASPPVRQLALSAAGIPKVPGTLIVRPADDALQNVNVCYTCTRAACRQPPAYLLWLLLLRLVEVEGRSPS